MKEHAEKCVERFCELAHKSADQLSQGSTPCVHDHQYTTDDFEIVGEFADVSAQIVLKSCASHESVDQTSYRESMHRLELSQNGKGWRH